MAVAHSHLAAACFSCCTRINAMAATASIRGSGGARAALRIGRSARGLEDRAGRRIDAAIGCDARPSRQPRVSHGVGAHGAGPTRIGRSAPPVLVVPRCRTARPAAGRARAASPRPLRPMRGAWGGSSLHCAGQRDAATRKPRRAPRPALQAGRERGVASAARHSPRSLDAPRTSTPPAAPPRARARRTVQQQEQPPRRRTAASILQLELVLDDEALVLGSDGRREERRGAMHLRGVADHQARGLAGDGAAHLHSVSSMERPRKDAH